MLTYKLSKSNGNGHIYFLQYENGWVRSKIDLSLLFGKEEAEGLFQSVEVVRCKDCDYYNAREGFCEYLSNNYAPAVDMEENDFCSKGKRRKNA